MRLFPILSVLSVSALIAVAGCNGGEPEVEDCANGADDDDDGDVDCDDSECSTDAECEDSDPAEVEDCANGTDDDGDGDADCDDSECEGTTDCPTEDCADGTDDDGDGAIDCDDSDCDTSEDCMYAWIENGTATVVPGVSYTGTSAWSYITTNGVDLCTYELDAVSTTPATGCTGCDFAFTLTFTDGRELSGDCEANFDLVDGFDSPYEYGYGYDEDYSYNGTVTPSFMYYYTDVDGNSTWYSWYNYGATATFDGTNFEYEWIISYDYY